MKYLTLILVAVVMVSCGRKLEEVVAETYPDETPKRVQFYEGEGEDRTLVKDVFYYENGQKRIEGCFNENGKKDGKWAYWYENGNKWSEGYFKNGVNDRKRTTWHENGQKHYEGTYDNGKRVGKWYFYNESGDRTTEIDYDKETQ